MSGTTWPGSTWERVCTECFEGDEAKMLEHSLAYLKSDGNDLPTHLFLGNRFREIVGARNRRQWWTTAREALTARLAAQPSQSGTETSEQPPVVIGRMDDDEEHVRAGTRLVGTASQDFTYGAIGTLRGELYESDDTMDRGGVVLRLRMNNQASAFLPTVRSLPDGIEIHMAGEAEGEALLNVLQALVRHCRPSPPAASRGMRAMTFQRFHD